MTNVTFVYQPQSGDRVVAEHLGDTPEIGVIAWPNGCRHVVGGGHLSWAAASRAWRAAASAVLSSFVEAAGGVAWDDRGELHAVIPAAHAWALHQWMESVWARVCAHRRPDDREQREVEAQLIVAGCARPQPKLGQARIERFRDGDSERLEVRVPAGCDDGVQVELAIAAPSTWFSPRWRFRGQEHRLEMPASLPVEDSGELTEIAASDSAA